MKKKGGGGDLIKCKSFCTAKETKNKTKGQLSEWEKVFANEAIVKELISKMYRQLMELNFVAGRSQFWLHVELFIWLACHCFCY